MEKASGITSINNNSTRNKSSTHQEYYPHIRDTVTVVIPTLNEEEAISHVLQDVMTEGYNHVLVVDGDSRDNTIEIVKNHGIDIVTQKSKGKTGAIKAALEHINTPYFVLIDGDCTYNAKDIKQLFPLVEYNKQVIGARTQGRENISKVNRFGNWGINKIFNLFFNTNLKDVCSGLYMLETSFAKEIPFTTEGFDVEVEISAFAACKGSISETRVDYYPRVGVQKLRPLRDGVKIVSTIFRLGVKHRPLKVLTVTTATMLFFAVLALFTLSIH